MLTTHHLRPLALALGLAAAVSLSGCAAQTADTAQIADAKVAPEPAVEALSPATGALAGGDVITLTGSALGSISSVSFDGTEATDLTVVDDSTVTVVAPHAAEYVPGSVEVLVDGGDVATLSYDYQVVTAVDSQLQYAFAHWNAYNLDEFGDFNASGGDCQNFVSQTLLARGWTTTDDWYNDAGTDWADAFVYAPTFDEWVASAGYGATRLGMEDIDQVKIGDIVMLDWNGNGSPDHVQIVSGIEDVDGQTHVLMVGHNLDDDFRDLETAITVDHPGGTAWFWSIPA